MADELNRDTALKRWSMLKTERSSWMEHWREISTVLLPRSGRFFVQDRNRGNKRNNSILDSTSTRALRVLAAGMMAGMTSPARPWFRLATPDPELNKAPSVKQWLADVTRLMLAVFSKSNTYRALHSYYGEMGAYGTAAGILVPDFKNVIHHLPLTAGGYCIAANWKGDVDTLYREFQKPVGAIVKEFGLENCSTSVQGMHQNGNLDAWVTLVHAIEPREDRDPSKRDAKNMPWRSMYFEYSGNGKSLLRESGFRRFNVLAPRWDVVGEDIYGSSPGMDALGDIRQLQHEQLRKAQGIDQETNPALQVPAALKGRDVDRLPGGITFVDTVGTQNAVRKLFEGEINLQHLLLDIQDVRERINSAFSADLFLMLANSTNPSMTATEVAERHEEKLLMLGPVLERLHSELLDPLVESAFAELVEAGLIPPPPPEMQGMELSVVYVSMLAQAQRAVATNSVDRFVGNLGQVAQFKPDVLDKFNSDAWVDAYSDQLNVDPEMIVANDKVALIRKQRSQAQAAAQATAQAEQAASAAQKLGTVQTPTGNAGADALRAFSGYT